MLFYHIIYEDLWLFNRDWLIFQIVLKIENDSYRNDKLMQLSQLLGSLSFPPVQVQKATLHQFWWVCLADHTQSLCMQ